MKPELLPHYKSAWSMTFQDFVKIVKVRNDDRGEPIIEAYVLGPNAPKNGEVCLFRVCELDRFSHLEALERTCF